MDFGPVNLAAIVCFCEQLHAKLMDTRLAKVREIDSSWDPVRLALHGVTRPRYSTLQRGRMVVYKPFNAACARAKLATRAPNLPFFSRLLGASSFLRAIFIMDHGLTCSCLPVHECSGRLCITAIVVEKTGPTRPSSWDATPCSNLALQPSRHGNLLVRTFRVQAQTCCCSSICKELEAKVFETISCSQMSRNAYHVT
jgi:hypothetical protein